MYIMACTSLLAAFLALAGALISFCAPGEEADLALADNFIAWQQAAEKACRAKAAQQDGGGLSEGALSDKDLQAYLPPGFQKAGDWKGLIANGVLCVYGRKSLNGTEELSWPAVIKRSQKTGRTSVKRGGLLIPAGLAAPDAIAENSAVVLTDLNQNKTP